MNDYFNVGDIVPVVRNEKARAEAIMGFLAAIAAGFDKIPNTAPTYENRINFGVGSGVANAYVVTMPQSFTLTDGAESVWRVPATNSGASVADIGGTGDLPLVNYAGAALTGGELVGEAFVVTRYDAVTNRHRIVQPLTAIANVVVNNLLKVTANDQTPGVLDDKIAVFGALMKEVTSPGGNEVLALRVPDALTSVEAGTIGDGSTPMTARNRYRFTGTGPAVLPTMGAGDFVEVIMAQPAGVTGAIDRNDQTIDGVAEDDVWPGGSAPYPVFRYSYSAAGAVKCNLLESIAS